MDTCNACGATNSAGAQWCNQCFEPLGARATPVPEPVSVPAVETTTTAPEPPLPPEATGATEPANAPPVADEPTDDKPEGTWTCSICQEVNPLSAELCPVCKSTIFESFGAGSETPNLTQDELVKKALMPGLAHGTVINPLAGTMVFIVVLMSVVFGMMLLGTTVRPAGIFVLFWGLGVWGFSVWDAHQSFTTSRLWLQPKVAVMLGVVPLLTLVGAVLSQART